MERGDLSVSRSGGNHETVGDGKPLLAEVRTVPGLAANVTDVVGSELIERSDRHERNRWGP
jgi:hypothetical protein